MGKASQKTTADIHILALQRFQRIQDALREERQQCLDDRRFYSLAGAQWEGALGEQFENKPRFEVNKIHLSVIRIINEYRNNRITVDFVPKRGDADDKISDLCDGLYRADEQDSNANEAYDNAFEEAVGGGFGAWRLRACDDNEDDDESGYQKIRIEPIYDADSSVFFDLNAKRQDKSDSEYCFVLHSMPVEDYIEEYGDNPADWPKEITSAYYDWQTPNLVNVAEYYVKERVVDAIRVFRDVNGGETMYRDSELKEDPELEQMLSATGSREIRRKPTKKTKVHKYILSGGGILEDCGFIAGRHIPVIPVYGKRWFIDGIERCMGHVRLAKDAQRLKNMQLSKLGELSAYGSVEKPIFTPQQVDGHQVQWAEDNISNYPYLLVNPITQLDGSVQPIGPIGYTKPPAIPPAMAALLQITEQDIQEILGSPQQAEKMVSGISGKAVELIQSRLDMQTFIYVSNFAKAMRRCGEIWLSMAREIYVEEGRQLKTVSPEGEASFVEVGQPEMSEAGELLYANDMSRAFFDVAVDVGPSSSSRRSATVRALTGMLAITQDAETAQILTSLALLNLEGEGMGDARAYFRQKLIRMGAVKPTDEEAKALMEELSGKPQDPNAIFLQAAAEEATAKAAQARANTVKTVADAELSRAKTVETLAKAENQDQLNNQTALETYRALGASTQQGQLLIPIPEQVEINQ